MKNEIKFREYMATLGELFDKPITPLLTSLYWKTLEPFTDEECEGAIEEILLSAKFFPKPAEFMERLRGKEQDKATVAWIKLVDGIRSKGPYRSVKFDDPVIHAVIEFMGGWPSTGDWLEDEMKWKQREFERLYGIMQGQRNYPKYLSGIVEMMNNANGYEIQEEVALIGNFEPVRLRIVENHNLKFIEQRG